MKHTNLQIGKLYQLTPCSFVSLKQDPQQASQIEITRLKQREPVTVLLLEFKYLSTMIFVKLLVKDYIGWTNLLQKDDFELVNVDE